MKHIKDTCPICNTELMLLDDYYDLPPCYDFIYLCPQHPGPLHLDVPNTSTLIEQLKR